MFSSWDCKRTYTKSEWWWICNVNLGGNNGWFFCQDQQPVGYMHLEDEIFDDKLDDIMIMENDIRFVNIEILYQYKFKAVNLDMASKTII